MARKIIMLFLLLLLAVVYVPAQTGTSSGVLDTDDFPQWAKDLRRWEIIAFGSLPFSMLTATTIMESIRWKEANNFDFSDEGRRYAPWPLKSAGAVALKSSDQEMVFIMAASLSVAVAVADLVIVQVKRAKARKRTQAIPVGTTTIIQTPLHEPAENHNSDEAAVDEEP